MGSDAASAFQIDAYAPKVSWCDHGQHAVQFYTDDTFLVDSLAAFIGSALGTGDAAIVVTTPGHRAALAQKLRLRGLDLTEAANQGRYQALDAAELLSRLVREDSLDGQLFLDELGQTIEHARAACQRQQPNVVIVGEILALLLARGNTASAVRLEQLWNKLGKEYSFSLLCAHSMAEFGREEHAGLFQQICREHSLVVPAESYSVLATENERLRAISELQQKAEALKAEVAERERLEQELDARAATPTLELAFKNRELLDEIKKREGAEATLQLLSRHLLSVRDEERRRVARELHDSTAQTLATLAINLGVLQNQKLSPQAAGLVGQSRQLVEDLLNEVRGLSYVLHPPTLDEMGLRSALPWYVERFQARTGLQVSAELPWDLGRFTHDLELTIFRIVQESLTNVHQHSGSSNAHVRLYRNGPHLVVEIRDRGRGMHPRRRNGLRRDDGLGISSMRERVRHLGGSLSIHSDSSGTIITAQIPS